MPRLMRDHVYRRLNLTDRPRSRLRVVMFDKGGFGFVGETAPGKDGYCAVPKNVKVGVQRWNGGKKWDLALGTNWVFFPTGICDPLHFRFETPEGNMEMGFNPLTGSVIDQAVYLTK